MPIWLTWDDIAHIERRSVRTIRRWAAIAGVGTVRSPLDGSLVVDYAALKAPVQSAPIYKERRSASG